LTSRRLRPLAWLGLAFRLAVALFVASALGFPVFVWSLERASAEPAAADAIIALTGGEGRLQAAIALLDRGKGQRLLISGVHASTKRADLYSAAGSVPRKADCCVDLGRGAENTIGNAGESASWIAKHSFQRVIIVTASYHMPRSLLELRAARPDTDFISYPVFPDNVRLNDWWKDSYTSGVLAGEYMKLLAATGRVLVETRFWTRAVTTPAPATIEAAPSDTMARSGS
jgi:uncharacterized SAM-binding protein YcdF (DUF218 family)